MLGGQRPSYTSHHREIARHRADPRVLRDVLLCLAAKRLEGIASDNHCNSARLFTLRNLYRIATQTARLPDAYHSLENDKFLKDLAIGSQRLLPIGSFLVEPGAGVPRALIYRNGARQAATFLRLWGTNGLTGYLQSHMNLSDMKFFDEPSVRAFYHICASEIERVPTSRGLLRSSWLIDPSMERVGKNMVHIAKLPLDNGAARFKYKEDPEGKSGALSFSPIRRQLFLEGKYLPTSYMLVWPRKEYLRWYGRTEPPKYDLADLLPEMAELSSTPVGFS